MNDARPTPENLERTGTIADLGRDSFERLAEEFAERCRRGESHSIAEYEERYPEHVERIRELLPTVALLEAMKRGAIRDGAGEVDDRPAPEQLGEFRVIRELGRGGMGIVYEAVQESLGRHVALKVIHNVHLNAKRLQRFRREAQAVARLHHTNIVPIFGVGEHEGVPYYVMQYINGSGLDGLVEEWRRDGSKGDVERWRYVAGVGVQAADALDYAHVQGILHRDIKPPNLLIDENRTTWITDFGLAKLTGHDEITASGDVVGTLRYLAPEALRGETDRRSDVYSLGLTLYELLTLNAPFGERTPSELLRVVNEGQPIRPRKLAPAIPRDLETIVLTAIAREPAHRYQTAGALAGDLKRFLEDRPILARRTTPFERAWRWGRRNRLAATLAITTAAAVLVAAVIGWASYAVTARALRRADDNVALSLEVFGELFDRLAARDPISTPPLGETGGPQAAPNGRDRVASGGREFGPPAGPERFVHDRPRGGPHGPPGGPSREGDTALLESILTFYERFARENSANPRLEGEAAWAYRKVGALFERLGREPEAENAYARAIAMLEALVERYPNVPEYRSKLVQTFDMAEPTSAAPATLERLETWLRRARVLIDRPVSEDPDDPEYAFLRTRIYVKLGGTLQRRNRSDEAESVYREAIQFEGRQIDRFPWMGGHRIDRATTLEALGLIELERGHRVEARRLFGEAAADLRFLMDGDRDAPPLHIRLRSLAEAFGKLGDPEPAAELTRRAVEDEARPHHPPRRRGLQAGPPPSNEAR
jgi:hypothetical protein